MLKKINSKLLQEFFFDNQFIRYSLLLVIIVTLLNYYLWQRVILVREIFVYTSFGYYPLQVFAIIGVLHLFLSVYAYNKDKAISHLLIGSLLFQSIILLITIAGYIIHS